MANYQGHSHVRGAGYHGKLDRICQECLHLESVHFGACTKCDCDSFAARKLSKKEKKIVAEQKKGGKETRYTGEAWLKEFVDDFTKRKIDGVD